MGSPLLGGRSPVSIPGVKSTPIFRSFSLCLCMSSRVVVELFMLLSFSGYRASPRSEGTPIRATFDCIFFGRRTRVEDLLRSVLALNMNGSSRMLSTLAILGWVAEEGVVALIDLVRLASDSEIGIGIASGKALVVLAGGVGGISIAALSFLAKGCKESFRSGELPMEPSDMFSIGAVRRYEVIGLSGVAGVAGHEFFFWWCDREGVGVVVGITDADGATGVDCGVGMGTVEARRGS